MSNNRNLKFTNLRSYKIGHTDSTNVRGEGVQRAAGQRTEEVEEKALFVGFTWALDFGGTVKVVDVLTKFLRSA